MASSNLPARHRESFRPPSRIDRRLFETSAEAAARLRAAGGATYSARAVVIAALSSSVGTAVFVLAGFALFR